MNPSEWIYHLSLRTALYENDYRDPRPPAGRRRRVAAPSPVRRAAIAGAALLVPALLVAAGLLGG
jgi:hypothetical protein